MAHLRLLLPCSIASLALASALATTCAAWGANPSPTYADLAPVFAEQCAGCHAGKSAPFRLHLTSYISLMKGSSNGPVVVPGQPEASELLRRVRGDSTPRMPYNGPPFLDDGTIAQIEAWIAAGAPEGPKPSAPPVPAQTQSPAGDDGHHDDGHHRRGGGDHD